MISDTFFQFTLDFTAFLGGLVGIADDGQYIHVPPSHDILVWIQAVFACMAATGDAIGHFSYDIPVQLGHVLAAVRYSMQATPLPLSFDLTLNPVPWAVVAPLNPTSDEFIFDTTGTPPACAALAVVSICMCCTGCH